MILPNSMSCLIGCHISKGKSGKLVNNVLKLIQIGGNAFQMFISPPSTWYSPKDIPDCDIDGLASLKKERHIYSVVHGKYIYNFCRECTGKFSKQVDILVRELKVANSIDCNVVIHQGKNVSELKLSNNEALDIFVSNLQLVLAKTTELNNKIILENSCHQGTELGFTLDELVAIFNRFTSSEHDRIGFCIDLCHIFVSGELDVRDPDHVDQFFTRFNRLIGLNKLEVIHFNDSSTKFNGHNDNHANIGRGYIGSTNLEGSMAGFIQVIAWAKLYSIPLILETPSIGHIAEIKMLKTIAASVDLKTNLIQDKPKPHPRPITKIKLKKNVLKNDKLYLI